MKDFLNTVFSMNVRGYIYGVAIAAVPVAIWQGWIEPEFAPIALPLLVAILKLSPDTAEIDQDALDQI